MGDTSEGRFKAAKKHVQRYHYLSCVASRAKTAICAPLAEAIERTDFWVTREERRVATVTPDQKMNARTVAAQRPQTESGYFAVRLPAFPPCCESRRLVSVPRSPPRASLPSAPVQTSLAPHCVYWGGNVRCWIIRGVDRTIRFYLRPEQTSKQQNRYDESISCWYIQKVTPSPQLRGNLCLNAVVVELLFVEVEGILLLTTRGIGVHFGPREHALLLGHQPLLFLSPRRRGLAHVFVVGKLAALST